MPVGLGVRAGLVVGIYSGEVGSVRPRKCLLWVQAVSERLRFARRYGRVRGGDFFEVDFWVSWIFAIVSLTIVIHLRKAIKARQL